MKISIILANLTRAAYKKLENYTRSCHHEEETLYPIYHSHHEGETKSRMW